MTSIQNAATVYHSGRTTRVSDSLGRQKNNLLYDALNKCILEDKINTHNLICVYLYIVLKGGYNDYFIKF